MAVIINYHFSAEEKDHLYFGDGSQAFGDLCPACPLGLSSLVKRGYCAREAAPQGEPQGGGLRTDFTTDELQPNPRAAKKTGQEVAAWALLTDINQQSPSSSANAASRSFQVVHQGTSLTGPVVRTHASTPVDKGSVPGQRTRIPHAIWYSKKKKKVVNQFRL